MPADVGCQPGGCTVPGLVRGGGGGGLGIWGRSASGLGLRLGLGGLGPGWLCRREHGLVHALGPGSGVGSRCIGASAGGGGPIEAGWKRALPGCLIVLCSLGTDWMDGVG